MDRTYAVRGMYLQRTAKTEWCERGREFTNGRPTIGFWQENANNDEFDKDRQECYAKKQIDSRKRVREEVSGEGANAWINDSRKRVKISYFLATHEAVRLG